MTNTRFQSLSTAMQEAGLDVTGAESLPQSGPPDRITFPSLRTPGRFHIPTGITARAGAAGTGIIQDRSQRRL